MKYAGLFYCLSMCLHCRKRSNYQEGRVRRSLTGLTLENICARPYPGLGFAIPYVVAFLCSLIWGERWLFVLFIVGIVDNCCSNFRYIVTLYFILLSSLWHYENVYFLILFFNLEQNNINILPLDEGVRVD
jgi:hypothetical protein